MVSALVSGSVRVRALAGDIVLCSWARHSTLTVPFSTQVYKWVPANLMLGVTLRWTGIPSKGAVEILLVASCYRNREKLRPNGPLGSYADFTFTIVILTCMSVIYCNWNLLFGNLSADQKFDTRHCICSWILYLADALKIQWLSMTFWTMTFPFFYDLYFLFHQLVLCTENHWYYLCYCQICIFFISLAFAKMHLHVVPIALRVSAFEANCLVTHLYFILFWLVIIIFQNFPWPTYY